MACGAQEVFGQGERINPAARRYQQTTARTTLGESSQGLCVRRPVRKREAGRFIWWKKPVNCVPLHARTGVGGRVPELFNARGSFRRERTPLERTRRNLPGRVTCAADKN